MYHPLSFVAVTTLIFADRVLFKTDNDENSGAYMVHAKQFCVGGYRYCLGHF